jgi:hypothetical protein
MVGRLLGPSMTSIPFSNTHVTEDFCLFPPTHFLPYRLYLDDDIRITRGSKGSLFIHTREPETTAKA